MAARPRTTHIRTPPLMDFDTAGVRYVTARAWQFCAWRIAPDLPEMARGWDEQTPLRNARLPDPSRAAACGRTVRVEHQRADLRPVLGDRGAEK